MQWRSIVQNEGASSLTDFSAPRSQVIFNEKDEFWYGGKLYDAVDVRIEKDSVFCKILEDQQEEYAYAGASMLFGQDQSVSTHSLLHHATLTQPTRNLFRQDVHETPNFQVKTRRALPLRRPNGKASKGHYSLPEQPPAV
jgi:hypothetical protein